MPCLEMVVDEIFSLTRQIPNGIRLFKHMNSICLISILNIDGYKPN